MKPPPCVLALDCNRRNLELLTEFLGKAGFAVHQAASLEDFDAALGTDRTINLALLDLAGFDTRIWERCDQLRRRGIPFLVISPRSNGSAHRASMSRGAKGVLVKPLSSQALLSLVRMLAT